MPEITREGGNLYYEDSGGEGPGVLLIQGVGVIGRGWRPQVDGLSDRYRLVSYDNRGIGRSVLPPGDLTVEALAADALLLLDHLGWASAHVVGHSLGGLIAQRLALTAPGRVRSLALLCTISRGADATALSWETMVRGVRMMLGPRPSRRRAFLEMIYPPDVLARGDVDALAAYVGDLFGRDLADQPPILMKQMSALRRHDTTAELGRLGGIPTLVLSAPLDPIAKVRFGRALAEAIPGARYVEIPGTSHGVVIERAAEVNQLLAEFWAGVR